MSFGRERGRTGRRLLPTTAPFVAVGGVSLAAAEAGFAIRRRLLSGPATAPETTLTGGCQLLASRIGNDGT